MLPNDNSHAQRSRHLQLSRDWLLHSILAGGAGSRAHFSPVLGWSRAYPETTGYIITTLLDIADRCADAKSRAAAVSLGDWLVTIQEADGFWRGGLYPYRKDATPSVFNTGQILNGLVALARRGLGERFEQSARRAAEWLAEGVDEAGVWRSGHYRGHQPDYYSFVTWPMLDYADMAKEAEVHQAAGRVVRAILGNRQPNGTFLRWGFDENKPAFTHTMAYTLQGLIESHRYLGDEAGILPAIAAAMERLRRQAELGSGRLWGAYDAAWKADKSFQCLTGNAQLAICLLLLDEIDPDPRLLNAAAKLIERLCDFQRTGPIPALRGAVAGSRPLWGKYMRMRYPNWAVKFFADALMRFEQRLDVELQR